MKTFDVLHRDQKVHQHSILEASAGTGKTFAIENIVSRLLIEERPGNLEPLTIEKILIVTFTKAATSELKTRVLTKLENDLYILKNYHETLKIPDYLLAIIEKGEDAIKIALKKLKSALINFDKAKIFTIHSFCYRMLLQYSLEANMGINSSSREDGSYETEKVMLALRDFLANELKTPFYSHQQLKIIAESFQYDEEKLKKSIIKEIDKGLPVIPSRPFMELSKNFKEALSILKKHEHFSCQELQETLYAISKNYKLHDREKRLKPKYVKLIEVFSGLFEKNAWDDQDLELLIASGLITLEAFTQDNLRIKNTDLKPKESKTLKLIHEHLEQIIIEASNPSYLFARVVNDAFSFLEKFQEQKEMLGHSSLLKKMHSAIKNIAFRNKVRDNFLSVIVDEFQDTDPVQWEIFSTLFLESSGSSWKGCLTLVGDPKQSIYAFRQADIYTYFQAVNTLGKEALSTLNTNYRSHPRLVSALNCLFKNADNLFSLPRTSKALDFYEVMAASSNLKDENQEDKKLEFWLIDQVKDNLKEIESNYIFPAVAHEILDNIHKNKMRLSSFAILVSDRYQAKRVLSYLNNKGIAVKTYKGKSFAGSQAVLLMKELLDGVLNYESESYLKIALGGKVIGLTHEELAMLENDEKRLGIYSIFADFKHTFLNEGFFAFITKLMKTHFHDDHESLLEKLLRSENNDEFIREWQDLIDFLSEEEHSHSLKPGKFVSLLEDIYQNKILNDERLEVYVDSGRDGVSVLTIHASKGLEFDHVVALGLINRKSESSGSLIPVFQQDRLVLSPSLNEDDSNFLKFAEEMDAEKLRQLYVAMTRAKYKLFVPFVTYFNSSKTKTIKAGSASPIELLMMKLKGESDCYEKRYEELKLLDSTPLLNFCEAHRELVELKVLKSIDDSSQKLQIPTPSLTPPSPLNISFPKKLIQSYVSIAEAKGETLELQARFEAIDEKLTPPHQFDHEIKTIHTLPSGNEIGILLHEILEILLKERLIFKDWQEIGVFIEPYTVETKYREWNGVIAKMLYSAINTEIKSPFHTFCIKDVALNKIYVETEFLMPFTKELQDILKVDVDAEFIKGVIDLIFEYEGKYYLVDWKSNWLGSDLEAYSTPNLSNAMEKNQYNLQVSIYMHALKRYISLFSKRPFEEVFGGCYYFFLRGLSQTTGIYQATIGVSDD